MAPRMYTQAMGFVAPSASDQVNELIKGDKPTIPDLKARNSYFYNTLLRPTKAATT
jgi:hypothetical protein